MALSTETFTPVCVKWHRNLASMPSTSYIDKRNRETGQQTLGRTGEALCSHCVMSELHCVPDAVLGTMRSQFRVEVLP